jgi:predicted DNA binding CopG/RHH family protein
MAMISRVRKAKAGDGRYFAQQIRAEDWRKAAFEWIDRRDKARQIREENADIETFKQRQNESGLPFAL